MLAFVVKLIGAVNVLGGAIPKKRLVVFTSACWRIRLDTVKSLLLFAGINFSNFYEWEKK